MSKLGLDTCSYCYQDRGTPDCSVPPAWAKRPFEGKLQFLPASGQAEQPHSVFGHFTIAAAQNWQLPGQSVYIVMVRNPLDRLFSGFQQNVRAMQVQANEEKKNKKEEEILGHFSWNDFKQFCF